MIIMGAMPAQHLSGVSHYHRRSQQAEHNFAGAVAATWSVVYRREQVHCHRGHSRSVSCAASSDARDRLEWFS
jgi:hypothetical protein